MRRFVFFLSALALSACASTRPAYDTVIRNVAIYDGSGGEARHGDVAIAGDRIAAVGVVDGRGRTEIDGHGLAAAPGFINVMSQAVESLIADGRGMSDVKQGVTTEIFGEGESAGPLTPAMKKEVVDYQSDIHYDVAWTIGLIRGSLVCAVLCIAAPYVAQLFGDTRATPLVRMMAFLPLQING